MAIVELGIARPKLVLFAALIATVVLGALILQVKVDTDPENMLSSSNSVRVLNRSIAEEFGTKNMLVLGIVEEPGVLNADTLGKASRLVSDIKGIENIEPEGVLSFTSVSAVPSGDFNEDDVKIIADALAADSILGSRVISEDGTGLAIYIPLREKGDVNGVTSEVERLLAVHGLAGDGNYLTGLPLAEEKFGRDMFIQMGLLAPLAGLLIFLLMFYFFRKLILVVAAMMVAMLSVVWTMGLLTGTGFTLHIMSSMIPVFLMPIAVLDSIHILSEFFERYPSSKDRQTTLRMVYKELATPITFTSLTTAVAFSSLALAPIPLDTLSFEKYNEGDPWVAYRQFCQHFLAPLALASYRHIGLNGLLRANIDGIPLDLARTLLPIRTQLRPSLQIHIHMHGRLQEKSSRDTDAKKLRTKAFPRKSFLGLIDNLESTIKGFKWRASGTEWVDYYDDDSYTAEGISHKVELVQGFLSEAQPSTVWDLGANTGLYSRLASEMGINTISFDQDPAAVDRNYRKVVEDGEERILPLVFDLNNPSPKIGWANNERMDLADRGPADMLLALALVHHLAISGNVPLGMVAEYFSSICDWAVVEFVPKEDPKIQRLLATRVDIFDDYNQAAFEQNFERFFEIRSVCPIRDSLRTLYLMRRK
jgi:hypothetical protein